MKKVTDIPASRVVAAHLHVEHRAIVRLDVLLEPDSLARKRRDLWSFQRRRGRARGSTRSNRSGRPRKTTYSNKRKQKLSTYIYSFKHSAKTVICDCRIKLKKLPKAFEDSMMIVGKECPEVIIVDHSTASKMYSDSKEEKGSISSLRNKIKLIQNQILSNGSKTSLFQINFLSKIYRYLNREPNYWATCCRGPRSPGGQDRPAGRI